MSGKHIPRAQRNSIPRGLLVPLIIPEYTLSDSLRGPVRSNDIFRVLRLLECQTVPVLASQDIVWCCAGIDDSSHRRGENDAFNLRLVLRRVDDVFSAFNSGEEDILLSILRGYTPVTDRLFRLGDEYAPWDSVPPVMRYERRSHIPSQLHHKILALPCPVRLRIGSGLCTGGTKRSNHQPCPSNEPSP
jgi:hypothetical protein